MTIKKLWERFGSLEKAWQAGEKELLSLEGLSRAPLTAFLSGRRTIDLEEEFEKTRQAGFQVITLAAEAYPALLKEIYDPPPVIYLKGADLLYDKAIAIVGTRNATRYGQETARRLAYELACCGLTIVSGMALGIDTAAHEGALAAKGRTIAVLGTSLDIIYPPANQPLAAEIAGSGAIISEFPLGTDYERGHFPRRNRIIAGLCLGTIVVEGHHDSGALITAKQALDQGREVFAVPGQVCFDQAKGPHWLIKNGAKLVESVDDVLEELGYFGQFPRTQNQEPRTQTMPELSDDEKKLLRTLSLEPKSLDHIALESGLSIPRVSSLLMMLEIKNVVRQLPGKMFTIA
ncbi:MAG: DNA-processing protein DprA [Candidatus Saganbacteria bacterium]|nr:DNA-processing protein DprA [Candidatus Saganbacteria bacterium]